MCRLKVAHTDTEKTWIENGKTTGRKRTRKPKDTQTDRQTHTHTNPQTHWNGRLKDAKKNTLKTK